MYLLRTYLQTGFELIVHFVRVRVSSSIPAWSLWSVRSQNSVDWSCCAFCRSILRVLLPCASTAFLWPGHRLRFLAFSQRLVPSAFGETRCPRFLLWSWRLFLVVSRRVRLMEGVVCDFLVRRGGPDFRLFGFPVQLIGFFCL